MKRLIAIFFVVICLTTLVTGCRTEPTPTPSPSQSGSPSASPSPASSPPGSPSQQTGAAKTGLAVITSLSKSTDAGEKDGLAQIDSTIVAVTVDKEGKIIKCAIDAVQSKINFDTKGQLITPVDTVFQTKNELADAYGMKQASGIGKEWFEQAGAFAKYVEGKSVEDIKGIDVDEENRPTGEDLKASVTVSIGGFIQAIEKAVANAKEMGASAADELGLGVVTNMAKSTSAGDKEGLAQAYSTYVVVTKDAGGTITSCIIDATQSNVNFTAAGKITTDLTVAPKTKNELGEAYGMKKASGIGKEWNEQAEAFAKFVTGKTADEVEGIAVDEETRVTNTDLKASVTITVGGFKAAIAKAMS
jgi:hypothetical protein